MSCVRLLGLLTLTQGASLVAQCSFRLAWPLPGESGLLATATWDPDGAGPERSRWVVSDASSIRYLDPQTSTWVIESLGAASCIRATVARTSSPRLQRG